MDILQVVIASKCTKKTFFSVEANAMKISAKFQLHYPYYEELIF